MTPFGNTVCLIHRIEGNPDFFQDVDVLLFAQGLRRDIEKFRHTGQKVIPYLVYLGLRQGRVQKMGYAVIPGDKSADGIYLILHESDKRRDHYGSPFHYQGRELVAE